MTAVKAAIPKDVLDSFLSGYQQPEELIGQGGLLKQLIKVLVERVLEAEMSDYLDHTRIARVTNATSNNSEWKDQENNKRGIWRDTD